MSLKYGILGLLNYSAMTGYDLDKTFKDSLYYFWQAQTSQIYRELDNMEKKGLLESERIIQEDKPNKRLYSITDLGKKEFNDWLISKKALDEDIIDCFGKRNALLLRIFFAGDLDKNQIKSLFYTFKDASKDKINEIEKVNEIIEGYSKKVEDGKHKKYWQITALYGEIMYKAMLDWAEKSIHIIERD